MKHGLPNTAFKLLVTITLALFLISCGSKKSPTGGPEDKDRPEVIAMLPAQFSQISDRIEFTFSKALDKTTLAQSIYIYPPIANKTINASDRVLTITIKEPLLANTNYYVTFTPRLKDVRGNSLAANQSYIFASGALNDNRLAGTISYEDRADYNFPVNINLFSSDSLLVMSHSVQGAAYAIDGLNAAQYIVRAYQDKNRNSLYDFGSEPWFESKVQVNQVANLEMQLAYADTTKPVIRTVTAKSDREIEITLSEPVQALGKITLRNIENRFELPVLITEIRNTQLTLITAPQDSVTYAAEIENLRDSKGNVNTLSALRFQGTRKKDTIAPEILSSNPRNGTSVSSLEPILEITFSEIIPLDGLQVTLTATDTGQSIPLRVVSADSRTCRMRPTRPLTNYRSHTLTISAETTDSSGNKLGKDYQLVFLPLVRQ